MMCRGNEGFFWYNFIEASRNFDCWAWIELIFDFSFAQSQIIVCQLPLSVHLIIHV